MIDTKTGHNLGVTKAFWKRCGPVQRLVGRKFVNSVMIPIPFTERPGLSTEGFRVAGLLQGQHPLLWLTTSWEMRLWRQAMSRFAIFAAAPKYPTPRVWCFPEGRNRLSDERILLGCTRLIREFSHVLTGISISSPWLQPQGPVRDRYSLMEDFTERLSWTITDEIFTDKNGTLAPQDADEDSE